MSEQKQKVEEILTELQAMIESAEDLATDERGQLSATVTQIREALERGETLPESDSLLDRLRDAFEGFEDRHPTLTSMVGRVADSLSDLGI